MTHHAKRRLILTSLALFALVVVGVLFICHHYPRPHPANQSQIDALNDALKNGLLTKPQYDAEIKKLTDQSHPQSQP